MNRSYVDPATIPTQLRRFQDQKMLHLVMSDEFRESGRSFGPGSDHLFEASEMPDYSNESIQYCKCTLEVPMTIFISSIAFIMM